MKVDTGLAKDTTAIAIGIEDPKPPSLIEKFGHRYNVPAGKLMNTLKKTAFAVGENKEISDEQMMALLVVADQYNLNPFTREIYAFPAKGGGIVPIVPVDGWIRIMNEHPAFDGIEFTYSAEGDPTGDKWVDCMIYRSDRGRPIVAREYLSECKRATEPWKQWPQRMLRHKALIQCARIAFGFAGIHDVDEGRDIIDGEIIREPREHTAITALNERINEEAGNGDGSDSVVIDNRDGIPDQGAGGTVGSDAEKRGGDRSVRDGGMDDDEGAGDGGERGA